MQPDTSETTTSLACDRVTMWWSRGCIGARNEGRTGGSAGWPSMYRNFDRTPRLDWESRV